MEDLGAKKADLKITENNGKSRKFYCQVFLVKNWSSADSYFVTVKKPICYTCATFWTIEAPNAKLKFLYSDKLHDGVRK